MEVGCQRFSGQTFCKAITMLGLTGEAKRTPTKATKQDTGGYGSTAQIRGQTLPGLTDPSQVA